VRRSCPTPGAHWRDLYTPRLLDRSFAGEDADRLGAEERLLSAAREQFGEVLGRYEPASVAEPKLREIERVVQAGWRELCVTERRDTR
jgi:hypothetical protein